MQMLNLRGGLLLSPIVVEHVVGDTEPRLSAGLCGEDAPSLFFCLGIPLEKPLELGLFAAIDHQDPVHELPHRRFEEQRNDDDLVIAARRP